MNILKNRYVHLFLKFIFSNIGLTLLVTVYIVLGAFVFQCLEGEGEMAEKRLIHQAAFNVQSEFDQMKASVVEFSKMCTSSANQGENVESSIKCDDQTALSIISQCLIEYERFILDKKSETNGKFKGQSVDNSTDELTDWSLPSGILFTASILSTIGYGHVTPKSEIGQLTVILYAVIAIPLMSMFLVNVGSGLGDGMRWIYQKISCAGFRSVREKNRKWASRVGPMQGTEIQSTELTEIKKKQKQQVPLLLVAILGSVYITLGMFLFYATEKWTMIQSLYFTFVSLSTIGFGDFVPSSDAKSPLGQLRMLMTTVYLFVGLAVFAMCISLLIGILKTYREKTTSVVASIAVKWNKMDRKEK